MANVEENVPELPEGNEVEKAELRHLSLEQCFKNIIEGNSLELDLSNLEDILKKDLHLNFYILKSKLKAVISYMLVHFIKTWPGWQRSSSYFNKQITYESWYAKFKKYLLYKLNYLVKNDFERVVDRIKPNPPIDESVLFKIDNTTQTPSDEILEAPFSIEVTGHAKMLNTLIFCEGIEDYILATEYKGDPFDGKITTNQLINWPHIEIEFISKELHFKRRNIHEFKRYLTCNTQKITLKKTEEIIEAVEIIDSEKSREAYTLNAMREYCNMYLKTLYRYKMDLTKKEGFMFLDYLDAKNILENFVTDITEINMNSIATNTSVLFNVGNYIYTRSKSLQTSDPTYVRLAEFVTPKINLSLVSFTAIRDANSANPFEKLQEVFSAGDPRLVRSFLPKIKYKCTYCKKIYDRKLHILNHFKVKHCMELPLSCYKCKIQLNFATLSGNRFHHLCTGGIQSVSR